MSEKSIENTRLKIEDDLTAALSGADQKNALDFIAYMKANGMMTHAEHTSAFEYKANGCVLFVSYLLTAYLAGLFLTIP